MAKETKRSSPAAEKLSVGFVLLLIGAGLFSAGAGEENGFVVFLGVVFAFVGVLFLQVAVVAYGVAIGLRQAGKDRFNV